MNLAPLPEAMHAPLDAFQSANLPRHIERLPQSPALPWIITLCGWHVGTTARAATALRVLEDAGIDHKRAALYVARQLRAETRNVYDRMYVANRNHTYPSAQDHHEEQSYLELLHRLGLFVDWLNQQGIR